MTKVVALQTWSNGSITMDEKSVLDIEDALASDLIAKGICADAATYFGGGGSGGGVLVVTETSNILSESFNVINAALTSGKMVQVKQGTEISGIIYAANETFDGMGIVYTVTGMDINGRMVWESANPNTASLTRYN